MSDLGERKWAPRSAWDGVAQSGRFGTGDGAPGITVDLGIRRELAHIIARRDARDDLRWVLYDLIGANAPITPMAVHGANGDLIWVGPDQWLLVTKDAEILAVAQSKLVNLAAVSRQTHGRALLRVRGPRARDVLAKGCPIDLHPRVFQTGSVALTAIAHMGVHLWQADDQPTYDLTVARSMVGSFWDWLSASAAEFGYAVAK